MRNKYEDFSFKRAAQEARRDFPEETRNITFLDTSTPEARGIFRKWVKSLPKEGQQIWGKEYRFKNAEERLEEAFDYLSFASGFAAFRDPASGKKLLVFNKGVRDKKPPVMGLQFIFDHELGHLIAEGGLRDILGNNGNDGNKDGEGKKRMNLQDYAGLVATFIHSESVADSFACLRGLCRKTMTEDDIKDIAVLRTADFLRQGVYTHLTTVATDALLSQHDPAELAALTPQQAKDLAGKHGERHTPSVAEIVKCIRLLSLASDEQEKDARTDMEKRIQRLAEALRTEPPESLAFHIAARLFGEAFKTGVIDYIGPLGGFGDGQKWQSVKTDLQAHLADNPIFARIIGDFGENRQEMLDGEKAEAARFRIRAASPSR